MKILGIIAEYNPFHNGHAYHIQKAKELTGADYCVVVMSGNFTQRGTPALIDKSGRTRMALSCGADLVLELPVHYASSSAEYFASGAVSILNSLGCVEDLCFGTESSSAEQLMAAADFLNNADSNPVYTDDLKNHLKAGLSFPAARAAALASCTGAETDDFQLPNNILGLEYCRALLKCSSSIHPVPIRRLGGYHDTELYPEGGFPSASAIRSAFCAVSNDSDPNTLPDFLLQSVPKQIHPIWEQLSAQSGILNDTDFSSLLHYRLLSIAETKFSALTDFADVSPDLADKIRKHLYQFTDWNSFCHRLKSRDLTFARISRSLAHILLDIRQETLDSCKLAGYPSYSRILGFRKNAAPLLSAIKKNASAPLFSSPADGIRQLTGIPLQLLQEEIKAAHIYRSVLSGKYGQPFENEYQKQIIIL